MTNATRTLRRARPRLRYVGFDRVEFDLIDGSHIRPVVVQIGSGISWRDAVRFPALGSDASETTGDEDLDALICDRASEALVLLEAATLAMEERRAA